MNESADGQQPIRHNRTLEWTGSIELKRLLDFFAEAPNSALVRMKRQDNSLRLLVSWEEFPE